MDIYIDVLLVVNFYITWILLSLTKCVTHTYIKPINLVVASLVGGCASLLILIESEKFAVRLIAFSFKLVLYTILILIAFRNKRLINSLYFIGCNVLLAGTVGFFANKMQTSRIYVSGGTVYLDISPLALILTTAGVYLIVSIFSKASEYKADRSHSYKVHISYKGEVIVTEGIADTGNTARDIFSGRSLIICNGLDLYRNDDDFVRAIPYNTVSGEGILYAVKPDYVEISDETGSVKRVDALVASIEKEGERRAIFNPALLR